MSCRHAEAKMHYLSSSNANHQFLTKKQSPVVVGTIEPTNIPIEKPPRVYNLVFRSVLTLSNRSIAFSKCFLISILKYFLFK